MSKKEVQTNLIGKKAKIRLKEREHTGKVGEISALYLDSDNNLAIVLVYEDGSSYQTWLTHVIIVEE